jgi:hypothetical protein
LTMKKILHFNRSSICRPYDVSTACEQVAEYAKLELFQELRDEAYFFAISKPARVEICFAFWEDPVNFEFRMTLDDAVNQLVADISRPSEHKEAPANWQNVITAFEKALIKLKKEHKKYVNSKQENT